MVGRTVYSSVPTAVDLENNTNQTKYTINRKPGGLVISKALCTLMAIGAVLLAVLVGLVVFFLVPRCSSETPQSLTDSRHTVDDGRNIASSEKNTPIHRSSIINGGNPELRIRGDSIHNNIFIDDDTDERLPRSIEPTHYSIQISPNFDKLSTHGMVNMTLDIKEETNEIIFHVKDLEVDKQTLKVTSATSDIPLTIIGQDYIEGEKYRVILEKPLGKNLVYMLEVRFVGNLNNHLQGFYRSEYHDPVQNKTKYLVSTQFSPTDARRAFPCFDEPIFKANFTITIARPPNMTSISNMPLEKSEVDLDPERKGWFWDYYGTTPKMSTYLVAFIISDLQPYGSKDKLIKIWSRKDLIHQTMYSAEFAPKVLHFLEDYFAIKFPLPKIDIVAVPEFGFNAMENWGLITFRESSLLFDQHESHVRNKRDIATILSHELGHQWFGNLVTPKWWKDLWLKEGFATYLQYLGVNHAEPTWNINEEFIISETQRAFAIDALESSRAVSFRVQNNKQIRQTFDELSYAKGACIIRMMNHLLGAETFKAGIIKFLEKYKFSNADRNDLFSVLTEEGHKNESLEPSMSVKGIMDSWTEQPGFPVITAILDRANKKLLISQKRFLFTNTKDNNATWWIPISITTAQKPDFENTKPTIWLKNEPMMTVDLELDSTNWYLLNVKQTGYYIVNYDESNWRLLNQNLFNLTPLSRAQLISDAMDLARANLLDYDIPLRMIAHMATRDDRIMFVPTAIAFRKLQFLNDILSATPAFGLFEVFHTTIFKQAYRIVDNDQDYYSTDYLKQQIRRIVMEWTCKKSGSECAIKAHHMYRAWMERDIIVPPDLRDIVYCTAVREGTEAEWNFAYDNYLRTNSVSEKNILLDALGCTTKKWLLSRYLHFLVQNNSSIRIQDADRVFKSVAHNSVANTIAFDFLRMNWNQLLEHYGEGFNIISKMVKSLPKYMNTEYQLLELINFKNEIKNNIGTASQAFESTIERVKGNVEWMKKNYHSVERWLTDHQYNYNLT